MSLRKTKPDHVFPAIVDSVDMEFRRAKSGKTSSLYSSSDFLPFFETFSSIEFEIWLQTLSSSQKVCLLYGETSSGKSRMIEHFGTKYCYCITEVDCASCESITKCMSIYSESTQSHSVSGLMLQSSRQSSSSNSMVVFEHVDSFLLENKEIPNKFFVFLKNSKVPVILTANWNVFGNNPDIRIIEVNKHQNPMEIFQSSRFYLGSTDKNELLSSIKSLLLYTENDIRKTAAQIQCLNSAEKFFSSDEYFYYLIPERSECSGRDYHLYTEFLSSIDTFGGENVLSDFVSFDNNIPQITPFSKKRENYMRHKIQNISRRIPHTKYWNTELIDMLTIISYGARHSIQKTRSSVSLPFSVKLDFSQAEIPELDFIGRFFQ